MNDRNITIEVRYMEPEPDKTAIESYPDLHERVTDDGQYVSGRKDSLVLDGYFSLEQLEALVEWMKTPA